MSQCVCLKSNCTNIKDQVVNSAKFFKATCQHSFLLVMLSTHNLTLCLEHLLHVCIPSLEDSPSYVKLCLILMLRITYCKCLVSVCFQEIPLKKYNKENQNKSTNSKKRFSSTSFSFRFLFCKDNRYSFKLIPSGLKSRQAEKSSFQFNLFQPNYS